MQWLYVIEFGVIAAMIAVVFGLTAFEVGRK